MARKQAQLGHVPTYLPKDLALGHDPDTGDQPDRKGSGKQRRSSSPEGRISRDTIQAGQWHSQEAQGCRDLGYSSEKEYTAGHIQKAKWLDYYQDDFKAKLAKLDRKKPYLVHCASGGRSGKSMQLFRDLGFTRVYHMNDGFRGWEKAKLPAEKGKPKSPAK